MPVHGFGELSDALTNALISGDFSGYQQLMHLPLSIASQGGPPYILADEAALQRDFDLYHTVLNLHGVTDIFRELRSVGDDGNGHYRVLFRVHIMARANRIADPFASEMRIARQAGRWRISEIRSTAGHIDWTLGRADIGPGRDFLKR